MHRTHVHVNVMCSARYKAWWFAHRTDEPHLADLHGRIAHDRGKATELLYLLVCMQDESLKLC